MNTTSKLFCALALTLPLFVTDASARVQRVAPWQNLPLPENPEPDGFFFIGATDVAIDGDSILATFRYSGIQTAILYRRGDDDQWTRVANLVSEDDASYHTAPLVVMKNNLALIRIAGSLRLFEKVADNWVPRTLGFVSGGTTGGYAISGQRILIGTQDCAGGSNARVLEPNASREWVITGEINGAAGQCNSGPVDLDLNYDYALVRTKSDLVRAYRRNGTALAWVSAGSFALPASTSSLAGPVVLQKSTAVAPGYSVFRRSGSTWTAGAEITPINRDDGAGLGGLPLYRDGALLAVDDRHEWDGRAQPDLYVYAEPTPGVFKHVGVLSTGDTNPYSLDVSRQWAVAASDTVFGQPALLVWKLRAPLDAPEAIANNFQARDVSGFQFSTGSQYAVAGNGINQLLRQSNGSARTAAVLSASNWPYYQRIEADVTPTLFGSGVRGVGLAARYVDADNYYYVSITNENALQLRRRLDGVETVLDEAPLPVPVGTRQNLSLVADGPQLVGSAGDVTLSAEDGALASGRAALITDRARADFDNVFVAPTTAFAVYFRWYDGRNQGGPDLNYVGGHWEKDSTEYSELRQTDTTGTALAHVGVPIRDQSVNATITLERFAPTSTAVAWFGLLARYTDPRNYYSLSVRSSNQVQIRKTVNGLTTVLAASGPLTTAPETAHRYSLQVIGNELHAFVDGVRVASAVDGSLVSGSYGIGTYRSAARWSTFTVSQP